MERPKPATGFSVGGFGATEAGTGGAASLNLAEGFGFQTLQPISL